MSKLQTAFGAVIKKRRILLDLTQGELASKVGLGRTSITNIEAGRQAVMLDDVVKIADALFWPPRKMFNAFLKKGGL